MTAKSPDSEMPGDSVGGCDAESVPVTRAGPCMSNSGPMGGTADITRSSVSPQMLAMAVSVSMLAACGAGDSTRLDGSPPERIATTASAFGVFATFTPEFGPYEAAMGITHEQYLAWAGDQHRALGAHWTRSNLQLVWDIVEVEVGSAFLELGACLVP